MRRLLFPLLLFAASTSFCQHQCSPPFNSAPHAAWADSVLATLSLSEQIAQLLMPPIYAHADRKDWEEAEAWVSEYGIGGVIAMQGAPEPYRERIARLQAESAIPLLISTDAEWGLGMRIDSTRSWPRALTFGAARDTALTRAMGREVGLALRSMGFHVNFAPVVDVNSNPLNPVIGSRSFGGDTALVAEMGTAYALGMQDVGVLATAKHFPGHGDTDADSHHALPVILHDRARLDSVELAPFKTLIAKGVGAMMAAHLFIPALDSTANLPSTLSPTIVDTLLRHELGFDGLVFTDAMTMKGFTSFSTTTRPHADALRAGNDVLLFPGPPNLVIPEILEAIELGLIDSTTIATKCHRVLRVKSWCRVGDAPLEAPASSTSEWLHQQTVEQALTVVKNQAAGWPWASRVKATSHVYVGFRGAPEISATDLMEKIMPDGFEAVGLGLQDDEFIERGLAEFQSLLSREPDAMVLHIGGTSHSASKLHGISEAEIQAMERCAAAAHESNVPFGLVIYGSPYLLDRLSSTIALSQSVMVAYQDDERTVRAVAQALAGAGQASGQLPVHTQHFEMGFGLPWLGRSRLGFSAVPLSTKHAIDSIAHAAIAGGAMPGCRVVVAHHGMVVHDGIYGTLEGETPVKPSTVYDLASITKIAATTLACMRLEETGHLDPLMPLAHYLPELEGSPLGQRIIRDVLSHRAGLKAWIPFYLEALKDSSAFSSEETLLHTQRISDAVYMQPAWKDTLWKRIVESDVDPVGTHRYSDLGFYVLQRIVESISHEPLESFVQTQFFLPAGWSSLGFLPAERMDRSSIAPSEIDSQFRKVSIQGDVHDPGAAMMGGVSGHAGLFGNAYDLARLMYMLRLGGIYGDIEFFEPKTVQRWVQRVDPDANHRRACGFDRPANEPDSGPTCNEVSEASFGHTGFTGTLAWADPNHDLIYIFLSNRTYPSQNNRKLIDWDVRTKIQHEVYKAYGIGSRFDSNHG